MEQLLLSKMDGERKNKYAVLILRIGLAFVFAYAAYGQLTNPDAWIGFFPSFLMGIFSESVLSYSHALGALVLAIWFLSGWKTFYAASLSAIALAGVVIFNLGAIDIVFRDVGLVLAAVALAILSYGE
jgi:uncharacterized membrane protein YphA (DoxX/SURF4 family)